MGTQRFLISFNPGRMPQRLFVAFAPPAASSRSWEVSFPVWAEVGARPEFTVVVGMAALGRPARVGPGPALAAHPVWRPGTPVGRLDLARAMRQRPSLPPPEGELARRIPPAGAVERPPAAALRPVPARPGRRQVADVTARREVMRPARSVPPPVFLRRMPSRPGAVVRSEPASLRDRRRDGLVVQLVQQAGRDRSRRAREVFQPVLAEGRDISRPALIRWDRVLLDKDLQKQAQGEDRRIWAWRPPQDRPAWVNTTYGTGRPFVPVLLMTLRYLLERVLPSRPSWRETVWWPALRDRRKNARLAAEGERARKLGTWQGLRVVRSWAALRDARRSALRQAEEPRASRPVEKPARGMLPGVVAERVVAFARWFGLPVLRLVLAAKDLGRRALAILTWSLAARHLLRPGRAEEARPVPGEVPDKAGFLLWTEAYRKARRRSRVRHPLGMDRDRRRRGGIRPERPSAERPVPGRVATVPEDRPSGVRPGVRPAMPPPVQPIARRWIPAVIVLEWVGAVRPGPLPGLLSVLVPTAGKLVAGLPVWVFVPGGVFREGGVVEPAPLATVPPLRVAATPPGWVMAQLPLVSVGLIPPVFPGASALHRYERSAHLAGERWAGSRSRATFLLVEPFAFASRPAFRPGLLGRHILGLHLHPAVILRLLTGTRDYDYRAAVAAPWPALSRPLRAGIAGGVEWGWLEPDRAFLPPVLVHGTVPRAGAVGELAWARHTPEGILLWTAAGGTEHLAALGWSWLASHELAALLSRERPTAFIPARPGRVEEGLPLALRWILRPGVPGWGLSGEKRFEAVLPGPMVATREIFRSSVLPPDFLWAARLFAGPGWLSEPLLWGLWVPQRRMEEWPALQMPGLRFGYVPLSAGWVLPGLWWGALPPAELAGLLMPGLIPAGTQHAGLPGWLRWGFRGPGGAVLAPTPSAGEKGKPRATRLPGVLRGPKVQIRTRARREEEARLGRKPLPQGDLLLPPGWARKPDPKGALGGGLAGGRAPRPGLVRRLEVLLTRVGWRPARVAEEPPTARRLYLRPARLAGGLLAPRVIHKAGLWLPPVPGGFVRHRGLLVPLPPLGFTRRWGLLVPAPAGERDRRRPAKLLPRAAWGETRHRGAVILRYAPGSRRIVRAGYRDDRRVLLSWEGHRPNVLPLPGTAPTEVPPPDEAWPTDPPVDQDGNPVNQIGTDPDTGLPLVPPNYDPVQDGFPMGVGGIGAYPTEADCGAVRDFIVQAIWTWQGYTAKYAGMTAYQAVNHFLGELKAWLERAAPSDHAYWRAYRLARWYGQGAIMRYCRWVLYREWWPWVEDLEDLALDPPEAWWWDRPWVFPGGWLPYHEDLEDLSLDPAGAWSWDRPWVIEAEPGVWAILASDPGLVPGESQRLTLQMENKEPGYFSFDLSIDTVPAGGDVTGSWLEFYIDGVLTQRWYDYVPWQNSGGFWVPAGAHTFEWRFWPGREGARCMLDDFHLDSVFPGGTPEGVLATDPTLGPWETQTLRLNMQSREAGQFSFRFCIDVWPGGGDASGSRLQFYIDGQLRGEWTGNQPWQQVAFQVGPGPHTFEWRFEAGPGSGHRVLLDDFRLDNAYFSGNWWLEQVCEPFQGLQAVRDVVQSLVDWWWLRCANALRRARRYRWLVT